MTSLLRPALSLFATLTVVTGLAYPMAITALGQTFFPHQANGSLLHDHDQLIGSELIGQAFSEPRYFWSRPSATGPMPYNAANSGGSNQGPSNPAWRDTVTARVAHLRAADPGNTQPVPVDLVTASASGLDPHISPAAAELQVARVAKARNLSAERVRSVVLAHTSGRLLKFIGEPRVNVLELNLALDAVQS